MIRFIKTCLGFGKALGFCPEPKFNDEDAKAIRAFLRSPAGLKLKMWMRHLVTVQNEIATQDGTPAQCGFARGYKSFYQIFGYFIETDSATTQPEQGHYEAPEDGDLGDLDHLAP
jgi:hypothetical protein